jgi:hypothetical protein
MNAIRAIRALGPIDVKNVRRDALLRWMVFVPLVVAHGGRLEVKSTLGQGSQFTIWLPVTTPHEAPARKAVDGSVAAKLVDSCLP